MIYQNKGYSCLSLIISLSLLMIILVLSQTIINSGIKLLKISSNKYNEIYLSKKLEIELSKIIKASDYSTFKIYPKIVPANTLGLGSINDAVYFYNITDTPKLSCKLECLLITPTRIIEIEDLNDEEIIGYLPYYSIFGIYSDSNKVRYFQIKDKKIIENQPLGIEVINLKFQLDFNTDSTFILIAKYFLNTSKEIKMQSRVIRQDIFNLLFNYE